jgi:putative restriction endonuclease
MRGWVAPTDHGWYQFFLARSPVEEVNFWRPSPAQFRALQPGEPFFFKLKAPHVGIGGFGLFARYARLPVWRVWEVFGEANGVPNERELRDRLARLAPNPFIRTDNDRLIGCISISAPVFFTPDEWVPVPTDWQRNIVSGRGYDLSTGEGARLWRDCLERAAARGAADWVHEGLDQARHGKPQLILPRLGQGAFRIAVLDAYGRACAVTTEHSLPVIEAAHIKPWGQGGDHEVRNGIPLRRDLHRLFDLGYVTIRPDHRLAVSSALREDYENGRTYYALDGRTILLPERSSDRPSREFLEWHGDEVFRA